MTWDPSIIVHIASYSNIFKRWFAGLNEKLLIYDIPEKLLNKIFKLITECQHENEFILDYYKVNKMKA